MQILLVDKHSATMCGVRKCKKKYLEWSILELFLLVMLKLENIKLEIVSVHYLHFWHVPRECPHYCNQDCM